MKQSPTSMFGTRSRLLTWSDAAGLPARRYRQAELVHCRWAMLGAAGVLVQEIVKPDVYFYEAGLPQNLPEPFTNINMGGLLAWEFLLMHWVEVRRWQDIKNFGSVNEGGCTGGGGCRAVRTLLRG